MTCRMLLADDHLMVRQGLRALLEQEAGFEVVAEADNGYQAVDWARQHPVDLVLMDISMPVLSGLESTYQIKAQSPDLKVVVLSQYADQRFVERAFQAGANGYVHKTSPFEELVQALRMVVNDQVYISPVIAQMVIDGFVERLGVAVPAANLTSREREILQLVSEGWTNPQMADHLHLSKRTVATHRQNLMNKLDLHTVAELTKYAFREGLTSLEE